MGTPAVDTVSDRRVCRPGREPLAAAVDQGTMWCCGVPRAHAIGRRGEESDAPPFKSEWWESRKRGACAPWKARRVHKGTTRLTPLRIHEKVGKDVIAACRAVSHSRSIPHDHTCGVLVVARVRQWCACSEVVLRVGRGFCV